MNKFSITKEIKNIKNNENEDEEIEEDIQYEEKFDNVNLSDKDDSEGDDFIESIINKK
jgi:hypothetical protein